jgi:radical SAM-linked protein
VRTWLVSFARRGPARYLSHLDTLRAVQRTFSRAGVELELSEGMRPKPRLSLPLPLPVGAAADDELIITRVAEGAPSARDGLVALEAAAPEGIEVFSVRESPLKLRPRPVRGRYQCELRGSPGRISEAVAVIEDRATLEVVRRGPKGTKAVDLRESVGQIECRSARDGVRLEFDVRYDAGTAARPQEVIEVIANEASVEPVLHRLRRLMVEFEGIERADGARTTRSTT